MMIRIILFLFLFSAAAIAHDHNRPDLDQWFKELKSESGGFCCDGFDAKSLDDADWQSVNGHYQVRLDGQWIDVPDGAVLKVPNRYGPTVVWPHSGYNGAPGVRCFLPGSMT